jgi:pSer/pThr/pTyr-binding forkhead associated (FHA) protein
MDAKLMVVGGDARPLEIKLRLPVVIGRGRQATLAVPHPLVSRKHCEIFESNGYLVVRDLGSLNGTYVNNRRVTEAILPPGQLLTLGSVTFRAIYEPAKGASHSKFRHAIAPASSPLEKKAVDAVSPQPPEQPAVVPGIAGNAESAEEKSTEVADADPAEVLRAAEQVSPEAAQNAEPT